MDSGVCVEMTLCVSMCGHPLLVVMKRTSAFPSIHAQIVSYSSTKRQLRERRAKGAERQRVKIKKTHKTYLKWPVCHDA